MQKFDQALILDDMGRPIRQEGPVSSRDWDEVEAFCRQVYLPFQVRPLGRMLRPEATMRQARIGRIVVTRFSYGVPIHLNDTDVSSGHVIVLNTLAGALRHKLGGRSDTVTRAGDSFVVDCSRVDHWLDADADHMQLNLTIPHDVIADVARRWFGFVPDDRLWTRRLAFGERGSRWMSLLGYAVRCIGADGLVRGDSPMARHLEELLCVELLHSWALGSGLALTDGARAAAPHYVREAEQIMEAEACEAPAISDVAMRVGVSGRTLSEGFRRFRGITPRDFLRDRRLDGIRAALERAQPGQTVTSIASDWGYVNFGALARAYRQRFGENPSQTLLRHR
ncbi:AraC family transcriptional regulator [Pseudodonghicola xiamenensis]|uniref:AraC family transcriptional regulator n=1 Tax=Pseudodonghicola xiamenensis TaxID=337702 RepID=A0A8J3H9D8_9RHOB|nr:AraC family transcriptional regulator [Pseudodonghicola xiamenensis]GHG93291.1 AraC family transcriptional regulator [Pseudodonghicola xiamenensis]